MVPDWSSLQTARPSCTCAALSSAHTLRRRAKAADSEDLSAICSRYGSTCADITEGSANTLASSCSYRLEHLKQDKQLHNTEKLLTLGFDQNSCVTQTLVGSFKPTLPTPATSSCTIFRVRTHFSRSNSSTFQALLRVIFKIFQHLIAGVKCVSKRSIYIYIYIYIYL